MSRLSADFVLVPLMALFVLKGAALGQIDRPISGDYSGTAGPARWILHLHAGASTGNLCNIDSPGLKMFGVPCAKLALHGSQVSFVIPKLHASFIGQMNVDRRVLSGTWDWGIPTPIVFVLSMPASAVTLQPQLRAVDSMMASEFAKSHIGSVTIGVVSGRRLIWTKSYGLAEMAQHRAANEKTAYRIGSITKMFTGLMLEQLVEADKVHVSDPVESTIPR